MINLFLIFLKIGFLGFGGGYGMLSLIYQELTALGISSTEFSDLNALDLLAPGPIAVNSATYVGYVTDGLLGAVVASLAVCVSSFVFSSLLTRYEDRLMSTPLLKYFFDYVKLAAIGMIVSVGLFLMGNAIFLEELQVVSILSLIFAGILRFKLKLGTIQVMFCVGLLGGLSYYFTLVF